MSTLNSYLISSLSYIFCLFVGHYPTVSLCHNHLFHNVFQPWWLQYICLPYPETSLISNRRWMSFIFIFSLSGGQSKIFKIVSFWVKTWRHWVIVHVLDSWYMWIYNGLHAVCMWSVVEMPEGWWLTMIIRSTADACSTSCLCHCTTRASFPDTALL